MIQYLIFLILIFFSLPSFANELNIYIWGGEIPQAIINQFHKETGIHVNVATYDSNEVLYAKLKATGNPGYDIILPSTYYVDKMRRESMLQKLDKRQLPNFIHIDKAFTHLEHDPQDEYSVPFLWGSTGIFFNSQFFQSKITHWSELWSPQLKNQLLMLDDVRECFSMALITLGYSPNDQSLQHIRQAYKKLKNLFSNVKVFNSPAAISIMTDEDAYIGMAWNGDTFKAHEENPNIDFAYPEEGFVIWIESLAIPKSAPHLANAYQFINFLMAPEIAAQITLQESYATTNRQAKALLPAQLQKNPMLFPSSDILKRAYVQTDISNEALQAYEKYWELLKLSAI